MAPPRTWCTTQLRRTLAIGSLFLGLAASASAQGTDSCAAPQAIAGFGSFPVDNTAAVAGQDFAPGCASGNMQRDVWFAWTAPASGSTTIASCGGVAFDSIIAVYNGATCPGAASIACNDDGCGAQSSATFTAVAAQSYVIQIGGYNGVTGSGTFTISGPPVPPANDDCTTATPIAGTGLVPFTTINASTGTQGQAEALCLAFGFTGIARDVWYDWTAPSTGIATIETCGQTSLDTKIAAYAGAGCPTGSAIACNDDTCVLQSRVQFACTAGQVYALQVGSYPGGGTSGSGNLNITVGAPTVKISQLYGAGGNTFASVRQDYMEVYNPGPVGQPLNGWSIQYASTSGSFSAANTVALPNVTLGVGKYLLVQQAPGTTISAGGAPDLPAADATGTVNMSGTDMKVALVSSTTFLPTGLPTYSGNPTLVDFVGAGTANWNDVGAAGGAHLAANNAPAVSPALAVYRINCGSTDTNVSRSDWAVGYPSPRNTATPANLGLSAIGSALPLTPAEGGITRVTVTPFRCATNDLLVGTTVSINATAIGGGPTAMLDNGTAGDEVANDGIYTAVLTVGAGTGGLSYSLPVTVTNGGNSGGSYIGLAVQASATAPVNDNCFTATPISGPFPATALGTLANATPESNAIATAASNPMSGMGGRRGVWYSVIGTGNAMSASLCATAPSFDSVLLVLAGTCDGLTVISTGDDSGPACAGTQASTTWCAGFGQEYLIWVAPFSSSAAAQPLFQLDITDSGTPCAAFTVSNCVGTPGPFTEVEAGYGIATNDGCSSTPNRFTDIVEPTSTPSVIRGTARGITTNRDVDWYRWQSTVSGPITFSIDTLGSQAQAQFVSLGVGGACPSTSVINTPLFVTRCASTIQTANASVTAGTWYAIVVIGGIGIQVTPASTVFGGQMPGGTTYQYTVSVAVGGPPANDLCANATAITGAATPGNTSTATNDGTSSCDAAGDDVWYTYTAGASAGTLSLNTCGAAIDTVISVYDACGGNELACNDDCGGAPCTGPASCLSLSLLPSQTVWIRISDKTGPGGAFTLNASFVVPPPSNDECVTATVISGNGPFAYDNRFATPTTATAPGSVCQSSQSKDIWYAWTSTGAGTVMVDTCGGPTWDSVITIYTGTCGSVTEIACDDDGCVTPTLASMVSFTAACNTTYYIRISSFSAGIGQVGMFNLTAPGNVDTDGDGTPDCTDGCPLDPAKIAPGQCGCGVADTDTDGDGTADCNDGCPMDPAKIAPGICGCGVSDVDTDGDGTADCLDGCPNDPLKVAPGICGCGVSDVDTDGDGTADCLDGCPNDPNKVAPGQCGCGNLDTDTDGDGTADCNDGCPNDPLKTAPGQCGCGVVDVDSDGDSIADCIDNCVAVPNPTQSDVDSDGVGDSCDNCIALPNPGQEDCDGNSVGDVCDIATGAPDCNMNGIPDTCDLANMTSQDLNGNTIPDECEVNGGTPYCFGYVGCPCGNNSTPGSGEGCLNSSGLGGMLLGSGLTSLSMDGLVLTASNLPVPPIPGGTNFILFFQGAAATNVPFQDGIRCATGTQIRLGTKAHMGGSVSYPQMGDQSVSMKGLVAGPGARYYQGWYRNGAGPCGTGSNLTNGLSVIWVP